MLTVVSGISEPSTARYFFFKKEFQINISNCFLRFWKTQPPSNLLNPSLRTLTLWQNCVTIASQMILPLVWEFTKFSFVWKFSIWRNIIITLYQIYENNTCKCKIASLHLEKLLQFEKRQLQMSLEKSCWFAFCCVFCLHNRVDLLIIVWESKSKKYFGPIFLTKKLMFVKKING